jgi:hypothetical protein
MIKDMIFRDRRDSRFAGVAGIRDMQPTMM